MVDNKELVSAAMEARKLSYTPYSGFKVGAALLTSDNRIYKGSNIECASYSPSNCAERTAVFKAVSEGNLNFKAIAIVGGREAENNSFDSYCPPCGVCRQVLREFCDPNTFQIILAKDLDDIKAFSLEEIFPMSFGPNYL